jgi:sec-independent protein translocase protein TatB
MFDIGSSELLLTAIVAIVVIGPKDLPRALYKLGQVMGKARAMTRHFRSGIDEMVRQVEIEEMEKKWAAENARIMAGSGTDANDPMYLPGSAGEDMEPAPVPADESKSEKPA